jgi:hypothetical protein
MPRRSALRLVLVALASLSGLLGGCGSGSKTPLGAAQGIAAQLLRAVVMPPGARKVSSLPIAIPAGMSPACTPMADRTSYWIVPETGDAVLAFLNAHPVVGAPGTAAPGSSSSPTLTVRELFEQGTGLKENDWVSVALVTGGPQSSSVRVDALVKPTNATCMTN